MTVKNLTPRETARAFAFSQLPPQFVADMLYIAADSLRENAVNLPHITESARARFRAYADRASALADTISE